MAAAGDCLSLWREENDGVVRRWRRAAKSSGLDGSVKKTAQECQLAFTKLLQKIQGLPAALPALTLELTVLYNTLLFDIQQSSHSGEKLLAGIDCGLRRVLEACGASDLQLSLEDRWHRVLEERFPDGLRSSLHQLAALQGALWLAAKHLEKAEDLFQLLSAGMSPGPSLSRGCQNGLLSLLQVWHPPDEGPFAPLTVQSVRDLKSLLWTLAALLQGVQELEADDAPAGLALLQAATTGLCSRRLLAQIFTLMGRYSLKLGKPQVALQHLRQALQVDFTFLPALHQASLLYRQLGLLDAELEALELLDQALEDPAQVTTESPAPHFPIQTELFLRVPPLTALFAPTLCPSEVKYLLAQRCLQAGRVSEATEHYLDLLALLQEWPLRQCGKPALPRIPEVFLEAASALVDLARLEEAVAVCEEVVARTSELVPKTLCIEVALGAEEGSSLANPHTLLQKQKRESLRCVLWRAAAYLIQGWAWARRGEAKEAISYLSRCLNDLLRVHFVNTGSTEAEMERVWVSEGKVLPQVRQLALTGRGMQFLELGQDKEALRDFQHSLLVCPESPTAHLYFLHTLWKVGRRQEAAEHWQKVHLNPVLLEENPERSLPLYLLLYEKQMKFPHVESLASRLESFTEEL
uniref:Fanconi anemia group G protein isoform X2 n=1 Tax=Pogona vitticeps TaxID=103695 RepID=A0ABM5FUT1_9SAUR